MIKKKILLVMMAFLVQTSQASPLLLGACIVGGTMISSTQVHQTSFENSVVAIMFGHYNPDESFSMTSLCTGTLVAADFVLTAAHCVADGGYEAMQIAFKTQSIYQTSPDNIREMANIFIHPQYSPNEKAVANHQEEYHDIALIQLETPVPSRITPATLAPTHFSTSLLKSALAMGYGASEDSLTLGHSFNGTGLLRVADIHLDLAYPDLSVYALLRAKQTESGVCSGDSGGPLFIQSEETQKYVLLGVTGIAVRSAQARALCHDEAYFVSVSNNYEWITSTMLDVHSHSGSSK